MTFQGSGEQVTVSAGYLRGLQSDLDAERRKVAQLEEENQRLRAELELYKVHVADDNGRFFVNAGTDAEPPVFMRLTCAEVSDYSFLSDCWL